MIKKWQQFLKENKKHEFGCVMIEVPIKNWSSVTNMIEKSDVYKDIDKSIQGIETNPHVTILYGLKEGTSLNTIENSLKEYGPVEIIIEGIDIFENDEYDVVKFNVKKTNQLQDMFDSLSEIPNENNFLDYKPHITISYVKPGQGKKYVKCVKRNLGKLDTIIFSEPNGEKNKFKLTEKF